MYRKTLLITFVGALCMISAGFMTNALAGHFNASQKVQIEKIVHDYLVNNPKVLVEAAQKLRETSLAQTKLNMQKIMYANRHEIFGLKDRPTAGNPNGDVIMVEFFDSQCIACKGTAPYVNKLIKNSPNLKVMYIDWPFFGPNSVFAAKVGFAAMKMGKYEALHEALMAVPESAKGENMTLPKDVVLKVVEKVGLDKNAVLKDIKANGKKYDAILKANFALAKKVRLTGTPFFVFANKDLSKVSVYPGGGSVKELTKAMNEVK